MLATAVWSAAFGALSGAQADFAYANGKWTVKEMLGHMSGMERLFGYRATSIGRGRQAIFSPVRSTTT